MEVVETQPGNGKGGIMVTEKIGYRNVHVGCPTRMFSIQNPTNISARSFDNQPRTSVHAVF